MSDQAFADLAHKEADLPDRAASEVADTAPEEGTGLGARLRKLFGG